MSDAPILALVAPDFPGIAPETVVLGLPMIRRAALSGKRAGFGSIVAVDASPAAERALAGTGAEFAFTVPAGATRLAWNVAVHPRDLKELAAGATGVGVAVASATDLRRAEAFLLKGLVKDTEGFMSRHFDRKISLAVSRRLAGTRVTPNQMTLVSVAIGLIGAPFFLWSRPAIQVIGGLLFLLHSILDGCDGELARLKFLESRWGGTLDFWGDNVVHMAVFAAMGVGLARSTGRAWPLFCGATAVLATAASAAFVYLRTMTGSKDGPLFTSVAVRQETTVSRIADALSRRDFIYLVLIMSAFGVADWFVVSSAIAVPAFFLALVAVAWNDRRIARSAA
jgi:1L-myo-inositol 1-phosphate cytidylyltransferase / CDP-L-myo-inositol myo-inositolphosphotransferase